MPTYKVIEFIGDQPGFNPDDDPEVLHVLEDVTFLGMRNGELSFVNPDGNVHTFHVDKTVRVWDTDEANQSLHDSLYQTD